MALQGRILGIARLGRRRLVADIVPYLVVLGQINLGLLVVAALGRCSAAEFGPDIAVDKEVVDLGHFTLGVEKALGLMISWQGKRVRSQPLVAGMSPPS